MLAPSWPLLHRLAITRSLRRLAYIRKQGIGGYILLNEQMFLYFERYVQHYPGIINEMFEKTRLQAIKRRGLKT